MQGLRRHNGVARDTGVLPQHNSRLLVPSEGRVQDGAGFLECFALKRDDIDTTKVVHTLNFQTSI